MSNLFLFSSACLLALVNTHPLMQSIQPYPVTSYQKNVYRPPFSEAVYVQPSNINPYSQPPTVQTLSPSYYTLKIPSLTEHLNQVYWDKLFSNPSLQGILEPSTIVPNQYATDGQISSHPYSTGGVVNNYIIVPPEYIKINETCNKHPKTKRIRNNMRNPVKESVTSDQNHNKVDKQDVELLSNKRMGKGQQNKDNSWSFNTDNIKCFTPADVLDTERYQFDNTNKKNKVIKKCHSKKCKKKPNLSTNSENKIGSQKPSNVRKANLKNKSMEKENNESKDKIIGNTSSMPKRHKKRKKHNKALEKCECAKKTPDCETKIVEDIPQYYNQDMNDLLLSSLLQQGSTDLENRHTRNSKSDAAMIDFRNIYPDLSEDLLQRLTWYMNDFYSPHSYQTPYSNIPLGNNMYPFDLTQIYQIPQFYNTDLNKSNGNARQNKNTKRKKKKKKKSSKTMTTKENAQNSEAGTQIPEINIQTSKTTTEMLPVSTQIVEISTQSPEILTMDKEINNYIPEKEAVTSTIIEIDPLQIVKDPAGTVSTDTIHTKSTISVDSIIEQSEKEDITKKYISKTADQNLKDPEKILNISKEIYETTRILESVTIQNKNENNTEIVENKNNVINKIFSTLDSQIDNQVPELTSEDEILNILWNDYYPDFRADNLAYLTSDEIDVHNTHDRYFYATDKNIEPKEIYLQDQTNQFFNDEIIYTEDQLENYDKIGYEQNKSGVKGKDESEEIVFKTPPALEVPDFRTRKINIDEHNSTGMPNNSYDDFNRFNSDSFTEKSDDVIEVAKRSNENKAGLVETVFAKSKVVKYGQEFSKSFKSEDTNPAHTSVIIQNDGNTTLVIAKSVQPEDFSCLEI